MGTNYDWHSKPCELCGRSDVLHVGKQSTGFSFLFQSHPHRKEPITTFRDWLREFSRPGKIVNEYGDTVPLPKFLFSAMGSYGKETICRDGVKFDEDAIQLEERDFS